MAREAFPDFCVINSDGTTGWVDIICFPSETTSATRRLRERVKEIWDFSDNRPSFAGFGLVAVTCDPLRALGITSMLARLERDMFCGLAYISGYLDSDMRFDGKNKDRFDFIFGTTS